MKTLIKVGFVVVLLAVGAIGWMAWQSKEVRHEAGRAVGNAKGKVNQQLVQTAERLADTLGRVKKTAANNQETKGK
jgi:hypothetical protein